MDYDPTCCHSYQYWPVLLLVDHRHHHYSVMVVQRDSRQPVFKSCFFFFFFLSCNTDVAYMHISIVHTRDCLVAVVAVCAHPSLHDLSQKVKMRVRSRITISSMSILESGTIKRRGRGVWRRNRLSWAWKIIGRWKICTKHWQVGLKAGVHTKLDVGYVGIGKMACGVKCWRNAIEWQYIQ